MVKLKLNENYSNTFLTTLSGELFFRDWISQGRPEWVEVPDEKFHKSKELKDLTQQGILVMKKEEVKKEEVKKDTFSNKKSEKADISIEND